MKNNRNIIMTVLGVLVVTLILLAVFALPAIEKRSIRSETIDPPMEYSFFDEEFSSVGYGFVVIAILAGLVALLSWGTLLFPLGLVGIGYSIWAGNYMEDQVRDQGPAHYFIDVAGATLLVPIWAVVALLGLINLFLWWRAKRKASPATIATA